MCLAVYLASSQRLQSSAWDREAPAFYIEALDEPGGAVRAKLSEPYIYYVGSYMGCGCGFFKEGEVGEELRLSQTDYERLAEFLREAMRKEARVELFACWEGDQGEPLGHRQSLTPGDIESPSYEFSERLHITVVPENA